MSYKVGFAAADVQWQILALQEFPQIANKHFYPAMNRATSEIKTSVEANMPFQSRSGNARREFRKAVSGRGLNIIGRVGWPYGVESWYVNVLENGAPPHHIGYVPSLGDSGVTIKMHPGLPALKFMERGQNQAQGVVNPEMAKAAEGVVNELARK